MLQQQRGSIINTASFVAVLGAATSQDLLLGVQGRVLSMSRELGCADGPIRDRTKSPTPCCSSPPTSPAINASTFLVDGGISAAYLRRCEVADRQNVITTYARSVEAAGAVAVLLPSQQEIKKEIPR